MAKSKEDYEENYVIDDYENEIRKRKIIGIILFIIVIILFILFFLKGCNDSGITTVDARHNESNLLKAAKSYFNKNYDEKPTVIGECKTVTLNELIISKELSKKNYQNCDGKQTKVKVCIMENEKEQWTPFLACDEIETNFTAWREGTPKDVVKDKSDIRFMFLGSYLDTSDEKLGDVETYWQGSVPYKNYKTLYVTTYYKTRDLYYVWNKNKKTYYGNNEYYIKSPGGDYTKRDSANSNVAKYYKNTTKNYWNNGKYSMTSPGGEYIYKDSGVNVTTYRTRTFKKTGEVVTAKLKYVCGADGSSALKHSDVPCSNYTDGYNKTIRTYYTCATSVTDHREVSKGTICSCSKGTFNKDKNACGEYSAWSAWDNCDDKNKKCCIASDLCELKINSVYKWYKYDRSYYPTDTSTASGTNAYYASTPASGYIRDNETVTTAYRWYKLTKIGTIETLNKVAPDQNATYVGTKWGPWSTYTETKPVGSSTKNVSTKNKVTIRKISNVKKEDFKKLSDNYVTEEELINLFNKKDKDVKSLKDIINKNGELKYEIKMYYRNRK